MHNSMMPQGKFGVLFVCNMWSFAGIARHVWLEYGVAIVAIYVQLCFIQKNTHKLSVIITITLIANYVICVHTTYMWYKIVIRS